MMKMIAVVSGRKELDFRAKHSKDESYEKMKKRVIAQHEAIIKYTPEQKLSYIKARLEYFKEVSDGKTFYHDGIKLNNEENIKEAIPTQVMKKEALLLFRLTDPGTNPDKKYNELREIGLHDVFLADGFDELEGLFLDVFKRAPNSEDVQVLKSYALVEATPLCEFFASPPSHELNIQRALDITSMGSVIKLKPRDFRKKNTAIGSVAGASAAEIRALRKLSDTLALSNEANIQRVLTMMGVGEEKEKSTGASSGGIKTMIAEDIEGMVTLVGLLEANKQNHIEKALKITVLHRWTDLNHKEINTLIQVEKLLASRNHEHVKQARSIVSNSSRVYCDDTSLYITRLTKFLGWIEEGVNPQAIENSFGILDIRPRHDFDASAEAAVKLLASQPEEIINGIAVRKYCYQRFKYEKVTSKPSVEEIQRRTEAKTSTEIASYQKRFQNFSSVIVCKALEALQKKFFVYESFNPPELLQAMEVIIVYGYTEWGIYKLLPATQVVFGKEDYARYQRAYDAIVRSNVTWLEVAERMVLTLGNKHIFGHLDVFPAKILATIPKEDVIISNILKDSAVQIEIAIAIEAPKEAARIEAMLQAAKTDPDLAVGLKLWEILDDIRLHATIIGYKELMEKLEDPLKQEKSKVNTMYMKQLVAECKEMLLVNIDQDAIAKRALLESKGAALEEKRSPSADAALEKRRAELEAGRALIGVLHEPSAPPEEPEPVIATEVRAGEEFRESQIADATVMPTIQGNNSSSFFPPSAPPRWQVDSGAADSESLRTSYRGGD